MSIFNELKSENGLVDVGDKIMGISLTAAISLFLDGCILGNIPPYIIIICLMIMIMIVEYVASGVYYKYQKIRNRMTEDELTMLLSPKFDMSKYRVLYKRNKKLSFFYKIRIFVLLLILLLLICYMIYEIFKLAGLI